METDSFRAMNTTIATQGLPVRWRAQARNWFAFAEAQLSRFQPDSELSKLNRAAGKPFLATPLLYQVLAEADRYHRETGGLFSPYLGKVMERLGYGESFERLSPAEAEEGTAGIAAGAVAKANTHGGGRLDANEAGARLRDTNKLGDRAREASVRLSAAELDPGSRAIRLRPDVAADLGGHRQRLDGPASGEAGPAGRRPDRGRRRRRRPDPLGLSAGRLADRRRGSLAPGAGRDRPDASQRRRHRDEQRGQAPLAGPGRQRAPSYRRSAHRPIGAHRSGAGDRDRAGRGHGRSLCQMRASARRRRRSGMA
ncbi:FAD:protein FMN transferase [Cohnella ginsengisoli]|uniref:FAD:protein FMN transferase n=1 Tax=Cohnella ginsengisoli TaxID=425004 RepID=A0A9X4QN81_9BACL|nr:FAD:protein FMN transferase [Cohnella ginsengisoli]MDG0792067.1 FAD:protein FMN transferase [Cohnella ginsengisoli]